MLLPTSPLAPKMVPALQPVPGIGLASVASGYRYRDRPDLLLMTFAAGSQAAGVFTRSLTAGAPVVWSRKALQEGGGAISALLVNAGSSNAFTGRLGDAAVEQLGEALARARGCDRSAVLQASTGVIGEPLKADRLLPHLDDLLATQSETAEAWLLASEAIRTTDTFPKAASRQCLVDGVTVTLTGIAKGSGMIAPDMATMLAFVATDAVVEGALLQGLLIEGCEASFNAITVDSDTSTSDSLVLVASGAAGHRPLSDPADPRLSGFKSALDSLLLELALLVVRDGEGAQKLISILVEGAADDAAAKRIGLSIANSPLVKTAVAGADANWGRIVMAVGKAGEQADRDRLAVSIGGIAVARDGQRVADYDEEPVAKHMQGQEIDLAVDVGVGRGRAQVWTCDLTHGYIDINADYRS
ncbi:MAG: bifunctional glutamate N-acetyltransferase/amino-acid acetyltransferase ArgJ [Rhodospirillales bacterium]